MHGKLPETPELAAIRARETTIGVPLDYQRDMAEASPGSALRLQEIGRLVRENQSVPEPVAMMAALGATTAEDCGDCVQIYVNLALKAGVDKAMVKAALEHRYSDLPTDLKLGFCFGRTVSENDPMLLEKGQALEARFGRKALVDLALVVALARFYPTVKRALGHSRTCAEAKVKI
ncbi:carboxymuconolactone decarboxylase family protein [Dongia sedimenti]|uniref:Carboxymuconolactone decarboxylase family protein n=1 Tax=Dongia sedimenti TaxID=3064282 RepID=A0ABU0YRN1_9PROT|nr:carboxymuconolactone decarboxylase family protein [Rhodospirillaceae bacterium R-7]